MVGAMHLYVTIHTLFAEQVPVGAIGRQAGAAVNITGVELCIMTLLAQPGWSADQQVPII